MSRVSFFSALINAKFRSTTMVLIATITLGEVVCYGECHQDPDTQVITIKDKFGNLLHSIMKPISTYSTGDLKSGGGGKIYPPEFKNHEIIGIEGAALGTIIGHDEGTSKVYSGPAYPGGGISFGPYYIRHGSTTAITPEVFISTNWTPDQHEECTDHKYNPMTGVRRCTERRLVDSPTSFTVDVALEVGKRVLMGVTLSNLNNLDQASIKFPRFFCDGSIINAEIRVGDTRGGIINRFEVHEVRMHAEWNK